MATIKVRYFVPMARLGLILALIAITTLALMPVSSVPLPTWNDKILHFLAFFVLSYLLDASQPHRPFGWRKGLLLLTYGVLLECLQGFTAYRVVSFADVLANLTGILGYTFTVPMLRKIPMVNWRWSLAGESCDRSG
ncbi:MAG: VanZ family protein [Endozoicomonas sp.]